MKLKEIFKEKSGRPEGGFLMQKNKEVDKVAAQNMAAVNSDVIPTSSKLQEVLAVVDAAGNKNSDAPTAGADTSAETVADDINLSADKQAQIKADEVVIRDALKLFDVDYDALIAMDDTSVYGRAVAANPQLLDMVAGSERPVLAALKIAVEMKPYADFMATYGDSPEAIKAAIKAEALGEKRASAKADIAAEDAAALEKVLPFSYGGRSASKGGETAKVQSLEDVFR